MAPETREPKKYSHVILVSTYPVLTAVNRPQHGCAILGLTVQRKSVIFHIACPVVQTADGQVDAQTYQNFLDGQITKFSQLNGALIAHWRSWAIIACAVRVLPILQKQAMPINKKITCGQREIIETQRHNKTEVCVKEEDAKESVWAQYYQR